MKDETNFKGLETICSLMFKLSHCNIIHQVFLVLIAVTVCLRVGVTVFVSTVCNHNVIYKQNCITGLKKADNRGLKIGIAIKLRITSCLFALS